MIFALLILVLALAACIAVDSRRAPLSRELTGERLRDDATLPDPRSERAEAAAERGGFDVVLRGYRMDQVDAELERLAAENAELQERLEHARSLSAAPVGGASDPVRAAGARRSASAATSDSTDDA